MAKREGGSSKGLGVSMLLLAAVAVVCLFVAADWMKRRKETLRYRKDISAITTAGTTCGCPFGSDVWVFFG